MTLGGANAVTRNRPVDFVTASFTTSYSRSLDKTHFYQKDTRPWHNIGEGGVKNPLHSTHFPPSHLVFLHQSHLLSALVTPKPLHFIHVPPSKSATLQHYPPPPPPGHRRVSHGLGWPANTILFLPIVKRNQKLKNPSAPTASK